MSDAPVFLLAGAGPGTRRQAVRFHRDAVAATGKRAPVIAYIGAASDDGIAFEKLVSALVFGPAAKVVPVRLKRRSLATSSARALLADADLLFFTGGDVERGMQLLEDRDLGPYLRELHRLGKVMEGLSAGSILLGRHWVRFPGGDDARAEPFACLGIVPHSFDCHGEEDDWGELRTLARLLPGIAPEESTVFGIPSGGAARWSGGRLEALGPPLVRVRCSSGGA
jgi:peptidase E